MPWADPDRNRAHARSNMARLYASRRKRGLCSRCGVAPAPVGTRCADCRLVQRTKRGAYTVDSRSSTSAHCL